jgi:Tol biopolymer transport system component
MATLIVACSASTGPEQAPPQDPPDPGTIVFVSDRETSPRLQLFRMKGDGSDPVRLTHDSNSYRCPLFSPDGSRILFSSRTTDGTDEIYAIDADGSDLVNLSNAPGDDHSPCYSPDGSRIVFASSRDGNREIYLMDADGGNQTRLTFDERVDGGPQFVDGGARILYYTFEEQHRIYSISRMDVDGGHTQCLTEGEFYFQNQAFISAGCFQPSDVRPGVSPDGSRIVFMSFDIETLEYDIFMMDSDGRHHRLLADAPCYNVAPVFTPKGDRIIFRSNRIQAYDIYEMGLEGERQTNLTDQPGHAYFCQFVRDDSRILYHMDTGFYHKIWLMNRDGSGQIQLTHGDGNDYDPRFLPPDP